MAKAKKTPFSPGDIVVLKSGGPNLTVAKCRGAEPADVTEDVVLCVRFDEAGHFKTFYFDAALLVAKPAE